MYNQQSSWLFFKKPLLPVLKTTVQTRGNEKSEIFILFFSLS